MMLYYCTVFAPRHGRLRFGVRHHDVWESVRWRETSSLYSAHTILYCTSFRYRAILYRNVLYAYPHIRAHRHCTALQQNGNGAAAQQQQEQHTAAVCCSIVVVVLLHHSITFLDSNDCVARIGFVGRKLCRLFARYRSRLARIQ